jgi:hypothetical protein
LRFYNRTHQGKFPAGSPNIYPLISLEKIRRGAILDQYWYDEYVPWDKFLRLPQRQPNLPLNNPFFVDVAFGQKRQENIGFRNLLLNLTFPIGAGHEIAVHQRLEPCISERVVYGRSGLLIFARVTQEYLHRVHSARGVPGLYHEMAGESHAACGTCNL